MALTRSIAWAVLAVVTVGLPAQAAQPPAAAVPDDAQRAYAAHNFNEARRLWTPQAEAGDPQAQLSLAVLYDLGQGVPRDPAAAYRWYLKAAERGLADAEFDVAVMCDTGDGTQHDAAAAALWYARASAHGDYRAQYDLGQLYAAGDGVPQNKDEAEAYFHAAAPGIPAALTKLAQMRRSSRPATQASSDDAGAPIAAQPAAPVDGDTVPILQGGEPDGTVELVWIAPTQATPVQFFVQLFALGDAGPREVFSATLRETSTLAPVQMAPGRYAWRVYSIGQDFKHYAASDWERFKVRAPN